MISSVIIENERSAADHLKQMLQLHCKDVSVIASFAGLKEAVKELKALRPQLVFLDIELDNESGFDLFRYMPQPDFEVIFTTGHDQYAIRAIKVSCLEYLLKPVAEAELKEAMEKYKRRAASIHVSQVQNLLQNLSAQKEDAKMAVPSGDGFLFINRRDIVMCVAEANYTFLHLLNHEKIVCSKNLGTIEDLLDGKPFFRCHRSYIVNLNYVKELSKKGTCELRLAGGLTAEVATRKKEELLSVLLRS